jgi:hypothetical protein
VLALVLTLTLALALALALKLTLTLVSERAPGDIERCLPASQPPDEGAGEKTCAGVSKKS